MSRNEKKVALVTGATSGLGFEAAAKLANAGYREVFLSGRTEQKVLDAKASLVERVGKDVFRTVVFDLSKQETVEAAVTALVNDGTVFDSVLLNAGLVSGSEVVRNSAGVERTVSASLTGHHTLTVGLLNSGLLSPQAKIVIAGSEAATGDVAGMGPTSINELAESHFDGDAVAAIESIALVKGPYQYKTMPHYATAKVLVALWAAALARRLPSGMTVNAMSPGAAPATSASRNLSWPMRMVMTVLFPVLGRIFGFASTISAGAQRYLDALLFDDKVNGQFSATKKGMLIGAIVRQTQPHCLDRDAQEATWTAMVQITGSGQTQRVLKAV